MKWLRSLFKGFTEPLAAAAATGPETGAMTLSSFTPRAQQVLALAREEAKDLRHNFIGTEHLLLGIVRLGQGTAWSVLEMLGVDLKTLGQEVQRQVGMGPEGDQPINVPYTPRVKKVLALASKEAKALNHTYVGTEHILLGLLREGDGVAARALQNLHVSAWKTRQEILRQLDPNYHLKASEEAEPGVPAKSAVSLPPDCMDTTRRFDVYCLEGNQQVIYRKALFKGVKRLSPGGRTDILSLFLELEKEDGKTVFLARSSILKFSEPEDSREVGLASGGASLQG